jgi:hypothetical protein
MTSQISVGNQAPVKSVSTPATEKPGEGVERKVLRMAKHYLCQDGQNEIYIHFQKISIDSFRKALKCQLRNGYRARDCNKCAYDFFCTQLHIALISESLRGERNAKTGL